MAARLAIFDCDGTLVDSQANICLAMARAFAAEGLVAPDLHIVRRIVGLSLVEAMRGLLPEAEDGLHRRLAKHYKQAFQSLRQENALAVEPLYDGLLGLLDRLEAEGWLLAVATGKSDRGLDLCLKHHGIKQRFVSLQTADRHPSKPDPSMVFEALADADVAPHNAVIIGDTSYDMLMGVNANIRALGVNWGYHEPAELIAAGADLVAQNMDELHDAIIGHRR